MIKLHEFQKLCLRIMLKQLKKEYLEKNLYLLFHIITEINNAKVDYTEDIDFKISNSNRNYFIIKYAITLPNICSHYQPTNTNKYYNFFRLRFYIKNNHFKLSS